MALTKITPQMFDTSAAGHDFNIDNGTFVVDASANRVGIGTTTPSSLLHVNGTAIATVVGAGAGSASAPSLSFSADTNTGLYSVAADNIGFAIAGSARAFLSATQFNMTGNIIASGNLGGTLTTAAQPNITSLGTLSALTVTGTSTLGVVDASSFTDVITNTIYTQSSSLDIDTVLTGRDVTFTQGSTNLMTIKGDASGVGIGESNPARKLSVRRDTGITAGFNDISEFLDTTLGSGGSVSLNLGRANSTKNLGKMAFKYAGAGSNSNALNFGFYDADNLMTLTAGGNVGIGNPAPTEKLHVEGSVVIDAFNAGSETGIFFREGFSSSNKYNQSILAYDHNGSAPDGLSINAYDGISFCTGSNSRAEKMRIDSGGKIGIGINPTHSIDLRAQYQPSGGIALNLYTDGGAWIQQKSTLSGVGSYQIGPGGDDWCVYDNTSSEYQIRVRDNANHKGSLQHKCHAHFQPHVSGSDAGQDEKGALAGAVYRLHNARIAPGQYSNNTYYVGVGRHYNKTTAFVEFKVNYVKASTAKCSFTGNNSADSQTRRVQLYWSLDGRRYTLGNTVSFGSGQATASYELTTNMISNTDSTFSGSIYWRCYLIDNASVHETLIGWKEFTFAAFAESMTFDGGFEQGVPDARKDQVTRAYGNVAGTEINYVPTSRPYGHSFTGAANVAVSSNAAYQQFTNKNYGYLNEDLMKIVTTPVHGIQILAEGQIMYSFNQDIITAGSTGYAYCQVRRHNYNNSSSAILGYHLITNTNGQWDMITGQGIFDVQAGDIISFYFGASNITNMDGGSWSYYNLLWWPVTVTGTGTAATGLPWAGEDAS